VTAVVAMTRRSTHRVSTALLRLLLAFALLAAWVHGRADATDMQATEYQVKAAYLCRFASYVDWPQDSGGNAGAPLVIGVLAADSVVAEMASIAREQLSAGRPIVVRRIEPGGSFDGLSILFIARTHAKRTAEALSALKGRPVLTVTEAEPTADVGSMINFVLVNDKVKFDIALAPAGRGGLKISARLLAVARVVTGRES
jgi:hypothetical protein